MAILWYALRVKPRCENLADVHLQSKGYETFLPTYSVKTKWSDRIKTTRTPLFPGYMFCRFEINARLPILITPGVQFVVGAGRTPLAVDEEEIAAVRQIAISGQTMQPWPYLKAGDPVEIDRGPLEGLRGVLVRIQDVDRLVVSVSLLMRSVAVELDSRSVKPLKAFDLIESPPQTMAA